MSVARLEEQAPCSTQKPTRRELERRLRAMDEALTRTMERLSTAEELAYTDALTGLLNRRALESRLTEELSRAQRSPGSCFGVLAIDVNDFKQVNDSLGHQAGDALLKRVADHLRATLRAHDVVTRTGGDEFVIIIPDAGKTECAAAISRIIRSLAELSHEGPPLSLAIGCSAFPEDAQAKDALLERADQAMYDDKRRHKSSRELRVA